MLDASGRNTKPDCEHLACIPEFDEKAAEGMTADEVRQRWPRFDGRCPDCGEQLIAYASSMHYIMGDY